MALKLNLYHEAQRAEKQKQYDPLKLSFFAIALVIAGLVTMYVLKLSETGELRDKFNSAQAELADLTPKAEAAKRMEEDVKKQLAISENLSKRMEGRFYWAPLLDVFTRSIPPNVQITRVSGDLNQNENPRTVNLVVDGLAAGDEPRKAAEELRLAIEHSVAKKFKGVVAKYRSLDDSGERVNLNGKDLGTALFSINVSFQVVGVEPAQNEPKTAQR